MSRNEINGDSTGVTVMAGSIKGAVNIQPAPQPLAKVLPHQLLGRPVRCIGRARELAWLTATFDGTGATIAVIAGTGGVGKTCLALHWAYQNLDRFPDGQLYVNLRGFSGPAAAPTPPDVVVRGFLHALGVAAEAMPPDLESQAAHYRTMLADRRMLIMLDNAHDAAQIDPLLPGASPSTVLITSRRCLEGLGSRGVQRRIDVLATADSLALIRDHLPDDERLARESDTVTELLEFCGGLPLALDIVAARAKARPGFPLAALADELREESNRLNGFDTGDGTASVRTAIASSIHALDSDATPAVQLLGSIPGSDIGLHAATSLCGLAPARARELLRRLESLSLIQQEPLHRYRVHDLVRLFAREHADRADATPLFRLVDFYLQNAVDADRLLAPHKRPITIDPPAAGCVRLQLNDDAAALSWFKEEHQNLLAAQKSAMEQRWYRVAWALAWSLTDFQRWHGHLHEYLATWQVGLDTAAHLPEEPAALAWAHRQFGQALSRLSRYAEAHHHLQQAQALASQAGDVLCQAAATRTIARTWTRQDDHQRALDAATAALPLYLTLDNPVWEAIALTTVSWCHARVGNTEAARSHGERALTLHSERGNRHGEAESLNCLGFVAQLSGQYDVAIDYHRRAAGKFEEIDNTYKQADALGHLGCAYAAVDSEAALGVWLRALGLYQSQNRTAEVRRLQQHIADLGTGGSGNS